MPEKIVAIDFETANYRSNSAIALGLVVIEDRQITQVCSWLIRPPEMWFVPAFIDIHGIAPDDVRDQSDFSEIWPEIEPYLQNAKMVAHNAGFDRNVLQGTAEHYGITLPHLIWMCTVQIARARWPELPRHKLNIVCEHLNIPLNHHDATSDALGCAKIYLASLETDQARNASAAITG